MSTNDYQSGRRKRAMERLQHQLEVKLKNSKVLIEGLATPTYADQHVPLTEKDIKRIENEIDVLKTRI